jgi:hypothetical protein
LTYRLLFDYASGWDSIRTPGRLHVVTTLALALLAGAGLHWLVQAARRQGARHGVPPTNDRLLMLWSTEGFPRVVNGVSEPRPTSKLFGSATTLPSRRSITTLRVAGIRTVVVLPVPGTAWAGVLEHPSASFPVHRSRRRDVVLLQLTDSGPGV